MACRLPPARPTLVLDVGAGSSRDAEWLASLGHQVVAVEPPDQMQVRTRQLHSKADIRWLKDRLPGLDNVFRLGLSFDFILLNAVWIHVRPNERQRAFRKLVTLLKPGGFIALGASPGIRPFTYDLRVFFRIFGRVGKEGQVR